MKTYLAQIRHINTDVEGEVLLSINGVDLLCFSYFSLPYQAKDGGNYQVELTPVVFNDYIVNELSEDTLPSVARVGSSFSYEIKGRLHGSRLDAGGIEFEDEILLSDFSHLQGKMISWRVDRIDAEFLSEDSGQPE